jgi:signal transduction histidine kinase
MPTFGVMGSTRASREAAGLELAIARQLVARHGGEIVGASEAGSGEDVHGQVARSVAGEGDGMDIQDGRDIAGV